MADLSAGMVPKASLANVPDFEKPMAAKLQMAAGNEDAIAHTTDSGILSTLMGTANKVFVDQPAKMSQPILNHEVMHKIQQKAGSFKDTGSSSYSYGGLNGLKTLPSISKLNPEQQANIPQDYTAQMAYWAQHPVTPQVLQQADQVNAAYARPMQQLAGMSNDSINVTPAAPGPPPAALTGMIKPLPEIGGATLFSSLPVPRR